MALFSNESLTTRKITYALFPIGYLLCSSTPSFAIAAVALARVRKDTDAVQTNISHKLDASVNRASNCVCDLPSPLATKCVVLFEAVLRLVCPIFISAYFACPLALLLFLVSQTHCISLGSLPFDILASVEGTILRQRQRRGHCCHKCKGSIPHSAPQHPY